MSVRTHDGRDDVELVSEQSVDTLAPLPVPSDAVVPESSPQLTSIKATAPNAKRRVNVFLIFPPKNLGFVILFHKEKVFFTGKKSPKEK